MTNRFEFITRTAKTPAASWSNHEVVAFHYFNPHGLWAEKRISDAAIDDAVAAGRCKSGAIIAYGGLNYYYIDRLMKLYDKKRVGNIDLRVTLQGLRRDIEAARQFLATLES